MHLCTTSAISFVILSEDILWFCVLASVRNTTVNVGGARVFLSDGFLGGYRPRHGCQILGFALFSGLSSGMLRLSSLGVVAMSIPTNNSGVQ